VVVTTIGNTSAKIIIADHATIASATYAWYLEAAQCWEIDPLPIAQDTKDEAAGISIAFKPFIKSVDWRIVGAKITNETDYFNLKKAIGSWEKNSTLLYLFVYNEWSSNNHAVMPTYATPTTNSQITGTLRSLAINHSFPAMKIVNVDFKYKNKMVAVGS
jgi:hypothetical protein